MSTSRPPAPAGGLLRDGAPVAEVVDLLPAGSGPLSPIAPPLPPDLHPAHVYLASLSAGSRRTMRASLETIAGLVSAGRADALALPWQDLRYQHTALIRTELARRYKPATANKMLSALRGVLRECFRLGYVSADDYHRARDLDPVRGSTLPPGRSLSPGELSALFAACAHDEKPARGARDAALLAVLFACGLRRSEVAALDLSDHDPESGALKVRAGKGNKERLVYAANGADAALEAWLSHRGDKEGPLFWPVLKSGRPERRRIHEQTVYDILARRGKEVSARGFSPHDMRRTFVGEIIDATGDLSAAQQLAGHANVSTTARYDRRGERAKKKAASHLHVPYFANPIPENEPSEETSP